MVLNDGQFDAMVNIAWDKIPERFKKEMENVAVVVEIRPRPEGDKSLLKTDGLSITDPCISLQKLAAPIQEMAYRLKQLS